MPIRRTWYWLAARPFLVSLVMVTLVVGVGAAGLSHVDSLQDERQACIERWADAVSEAVEGGRQLWSDVARQFREGTQDRDRFALLLEEYEAAVGEAELARLRCG